MHDVPDQKKIAMWVLLGVTGMILIGMLYFGTRLKGFRPENNVMWVPNESGIHFDRFSVAYSDGFLTSSETEIKGHSDVTIEMILRPVFSSYPNFQCVLTVHNGKGATQLVVGQWRTWFIIMNGKDYDGKNGRDRISINLADYKKKKIFLTFVSNASGTKIYLNGALKETRRKVILRYPEHTRKSRLTVGNSVHGRNAWVGTIYGLLFYDVSLNDTAIQDRYHRFQEGELFFDDSIYLSKMAYAFQEKSGEMVQNEMGKQFPLIVPKWMKIIEKEVLLLPHRRLEIDKNFMIDTVVNFVGFMPLGFFLGALFNRMQRWHRSRYRWVVVSSIFFFSLFIEIIQIWIPSRTSSMLDLSLNTMGGFLGASFYLWWEPLFLDLFNRVLGLFKSYP